MRIGGRGFGPALYDGRRMERKEAGADGRAERQAERFLGGVLWSWLSVATSLGSALILAPVMIRSLGPERYGLWALAFSLVEYFFVFDLGFRSAVVNQNARLWANRDYEQINEVINTALVYFLGIGAVIMALALAFSGEVHRFFIIRPEYRPAFALLVTIIGISWALGMICNTFQASLEAFQQFKTQSRIFVTTSFLRLAGSLAVLGLGGGLEELGWMVVGAQVTGYALTAWALKQALPQWELAWRYVSRERWRSLVSYGYSSFLANTAQLFLGQGPAVMIGHYRPEAHVGYYGLPSRLMQAVVDGLTRIGFVTAPNTAQMVAEGRRHQVAQLGMHLNRYCFALFLPVCVFLWFYGQELLTVWVGAEMAAQSAPLLLPVALGNALALAAQFNSSSILFGLAQHHAYARNAVLEAVLLCGGLAVVIPRYGILGAAWLVAVLMILNRGLATPWLLCRYLDFSFAGYMSFIYGRPLLAAAPGVAVGLALRAAGWGGRSLPELALAGGLIAASMFAAAWWLCLEGEHRQMLRGWVGKRLASRLA